MLLMTQKAQELSLPMPDEPVETPCFVILEEAIHHNLHQTSVLAGGVERLVPHVKTHRSPWVTRTLIELGVSAFKTATTREVEMVLEAGSPEVIWSYPTSSEAAISRVLAAAAKYPQARVTGVVDDMSGLEAWKKCLATAPQANVDLRVDIDPGMGRTGAAIGEPALKLAEALQKMGRFAGWHVYDGHIQDLDLLVREARFLALQSTLQTLFSEAKAQGLSVDVVGGGSYTFPFWAQHTDARVSPGSWVYSNSQHQTDQPHRGWEVGAYVLSRVVSEHNGTLTLDAGSKAIAPDMPMAQRFVGVGVSQIVKMNEEHTLATAPGLHPGDLVALLPRHTCTTAYLYRKALVLTQSGHWEYREQLGCER